MKATLFALFLVISVVGSATSMSPGTPTKEVCRAVKKCTKLLKKDKECPTIPVPKDSLLPPLENPYRLTILRKGVWLYEDGAYLSLILKSGKRLVLLDLPDSAGSNKPDGSGTRLTDAAEEVLGKTVPTRIDIVYSHAHYDHIGAATRFVTYAKKKYPKAKFAVWGTEESKRLVEKSVTKRAVVPNIIIGEKGATLKLEKGLEVKMMIIGGHTQTDLVLYIPKYKKEASIAMYVDVIFPGWTPPFDLAITINVGDYILAQKELLKLDFDIFISGHLQRGTKEDVRKNLKYSEDLVEASRTAVASITPQDLADAGIGLVSDPEAVEFGNIWFAFIGVQRRLEIDACYKIMFPKWGCKLAGIDFTLRGHCFTAITWVLTDY